GWRRDGERRPAAVLGGGDVGGVAAQPYVGDHLAARAVDDVERAVGFVADVDALPVRREIDSVRRLDAVDDLHDLVGGRVDDVEVDAGAVGHVDADRLRGERQCCQGEKDGQVPNGGRHGFLLEATSVAPANIG